MRRPPTADGAELARLNHASSTSKEESAAEIITSLEDVVEWIWRANGIANA